MQSKQPEGKQERQKLDFEDDEARRERLGESSRLPVRGLANARIGKLFSNISKDAPSDETNPLDFSRTRPHAVPESDGMSMIYL
jgi:hypothetical protein